MRSFAMLAVMAGLTATSAVADESYGLFVGVSGGAADMDETLERLDLGDLDVDLQVEDTSPAWSAFGGYRFSPHLGIRGGYVDFQTFDDLLELAPVGDVPDVNLDLEGWMVGLDAYLPLSAWFSFVGHAGYMDWQSKLSIDDFDFQAEDGGTDPFFGAGMQIDLIPNLGIEANYTRFDMNGSDVDYGSLGVQFSF